jgi:uncharacterized membrane protein (DUF106 family)
MMPALTVEDFEAMYRASDKARLDRIEAAQVRIEAKLDALIKQTVKPKYTYMGPD